MTPLICPLTELKRALERCDRRAAHRACDAVIEMRRAGAVSLPAPMRH